MYGVYQKQLAILPITDMRVVLVITAPILEHFGRNDPTDAPEAGNVNQFGLRTGGIKLPNIA